MSTKRIFLKPRMTGAIIRNPLNGAILPEEGALVPNSNYWLRRIVQGDVIVENREEEKASTKKRKQQ